MSHMLIAVDLDLDDVEIIDEGRWVTVAYLEDTYIPPSITLKNDQQLTVTIEGVMQIKEALTVAGKPFIYRPRR